jgi:hypothetical protein
MGTVLKVRHRAMDRLRAVKLLHLEDATRDPELVERFRREATIASDLSHPNIVQIHDFDFTPAGEPYIAMEYLEGEDLGRLVAREERLSLARTVELLSGVADALDRVHELGVVHRDLKPANLFLTGDHTVKILDFGISHVEWEGPNLTQTGDILGTPMYMSPEQLRGDKVDSRTDVYALAAVAYELLTGHGPIEASNPAVLVARILEQTPRPASEWASELPDHVVDALERALSKSPADRLATAGEFMLALAGPELAAGLDRTSAMIAARLTHTGRKTVPMDHRPRRRLVSIIAGAVLVLAAAAIGVFLLGGEPEDPEPAATEGTIPWPLMVLPAEVDIAGIEDGWLPGAVARMVEAYLGLDPRYRLITSAEAAAGLGARYAAPGAEPDADHLAQLGRVVSAGSVLGLRLTRQGGELQLRFDLVNAESGERIWSHEARGDGFESAAEAGTWNMSEELLADAPFPQLSQDDVARCGVDGEGCRDVIAAEEAVLLLGARPRLARLAPRLLSAPTTAMIPRLAEYLGCVESSLAPDCSELLSGIETPPALSAERAEAWRAVMAVGRGETAERQQVCTFGASEDALVRTIGYLLVVGNPCPSTDQLFCAHVGTFIDRYICLDRSVIYDAPDTAFSYFEKFAEQELAHPIIVLTFSSVPLSRDVDLAARWLERTSLRGGVDEEILANSMFRLEMARRDANEALHWARRSLYPTWREGQAQLLAGKLRHATDKMATEASRLPNLKEFLLHGVARPGVQPATILRDPALVEIWTEVLSRAEERTPPVEGIAAFFETLSQGERVICRSLDPAKERFAAELLYRCERWDELIEYTARNHGDGTAERASRFLVAEAQLALGNLTEAEQTFAAVESDSMQRAIFPVGSIIALERLGRLAEKRGDVETARERYTELVRLWGTTDMPIPEVEAAREGLARLGE